MTRGKPTVAFVGAGRLARALAPLLEAAGYPIVAVASRTRRSATRLSRELRDATPTRDAGGAALAARVLILSVPDGALRPLASALAGDGRIPWRHRTVLHASGALGIEVLTALARAGASVGVLHPLQCLGRADIAARYLPGSRARVEGDPRARRIARRIATDLGLVPLRLATRSSRKLRADYHAAASLASNDIVAILASAADLLHSLGPSKRASMKALVPLARCTLAHLEAGGVAAALTGPAARGDAETIAAHFRGGLRGPAGEAHRSLSEILVRLGQSLRRLPDRRARVVRSVLSGKRPRGRSRRSAL